MKAAAAAVPADAVTPQDAGAQVADIATQIAAIDAQASTIVTKYVAARRQLLDLAAQRQALVDQLDAVTRPIAALADWRDALRASGEQTTP